MAAPGRGGAWATWLRGAPPVEDGTIRPGDAPGFGVALDPASLGSQRIQRPRVMTSARRSADYASASVRASSSARATQRGTSSAVKSPRASARCRAASSIRPRARATVARSRRVRATS